MAKVLVLYYSSYGHIETMAKAVAEGARTAGAEVALRRVPELVPQDIAAKSHFKLDQEAPVATVNMAAQMKNFLDQAGGLWATNKLVGKVGAVFTSTATQHGGQESTILATHTVLLHFGMVIVGLPYSYGAQMGLGEILGGSPYGASTIAGGDGSRQPSQIELDGARFQGRHVAEIAARLAR